MDGGRAGVHACHLAAGRVEAGVGDGQGGACARTGRVAEGSSSSAPPRGSSTRRRDGLRASHPPAPSPHAGAPPPWPPLAPWKPSQRCPDHGVQAGRAAFPCYLPTVRPAGRRLLLKMPRQTSDILPRSAAAPRTPAGSLPDPSPGHPPQPGTLPQLSGGPPELRTACHGRPRLPGVPWPRCPAFHRVPPSARSPVRGPAARPG